MPIADGTICTVNSQLDTVAADDAGLGKHADHEKGAVYFLYAHEAETKEGRRSVRFYSINGLWAIPESCLVPTSTLADWEPIEYRSPEPDANGQYQFIQWDGGRGEWEADGSREYFPTPEAAAEWLAKQTEDTVVDLERAETKAAKLLQRVVDHAANWSVWEAGFAEIDRDIRAYLLTQEKQEE